MKNSGKRFSTDSQLIFVLIINYSHIYRERASDPRMSRNGIRPTRDETHLKCCDFSTPFQYFHCDLNVSKQIHWKSINFNHLFKIETNGRTTESEGGKRKTDSVVDDFKQNSQDPLLIPILRTEKKVNDVSDIVCHCRCRYVSFRTIEHNKWPLCISCRKSVYPSWHVYPYVWLFRSLYHTHTHALA